MTTGLASLAAICSFARFTLVLLAAVSAMYAAQPQGIQLNATGMSYIYPVFDTDGWVLTQHVTLGNRVTHGGDDYYAQDWARGCGITHNKSVYAGISGRVVVAGYSTSGYGNTVVIYDDVSGFALRYAHLMNDSLAVRKDDYVTAGISRIGKVGNTGTSLTDTSCTTYKSAHLHLSLYKNVAASNISDVTQQPVHRTNFSGDPSIYSADFRYNPGVMLFKGDQSAAVWVWGPDFRKHYVSKDVFDLQGWNFDKNRTLFNPLPPGNIYPQWQVDSWAESAYFWPPREQMLVRGVTDPTVFLIQNRAKWGVPGEIFACRGYSFADVKTVPQAEVERYSPGVVAPSLSLADCQGYVVGGAPGNPILFLQNVSNWGLSAWFMGGPNGSDLNSGPWFSNTVPNWSLRGSGDMNNDQIQDLVFQNPLTGQVSVWFMTGTSGLTLSSGPIIATAAANWEIRSVGDMDSDGTPDFLLQHRDTNQISVWFMAPGGLGYRAAPIIGRSAAGWRVVGSGDVNQDGVRDIVLQHEGTGALSVWFMNPGGATVASDPVVAYPAAGWSFAGMSDFDGNGTFDYIFQNIATGGVSVWYLTGPDGGTFLAAPVIRYAATGWQIRGAR